MFCRCFYIRLSPREDSAVLVPYRCHMEDDPIVVLPPNHKPVGNDVACQTQLKMLPEVQYVVITLPCSLEHGNVKSRFSRERVHLSSLRSARMMGCMSSRCVLRCVEKLICWFVVSGAGLRWRRGDDGLPTRAAGPCHAECQQPLGMNRAHERPTFRIEDERL